MKRLIIVIGIIGVILTSNGCERREKIKAPLFSNLSNFHHPITTKSPLAQRYFDQGLTFVYGFDYGEAERSFHAAIAADPGCAMCYWGLALALGSTNNTFLDGTEKQQAIAAIQMAMKKVDPLNNSERSYINALSQRYSRELPTLVKSVDQICSAQNIVTQSEAKAYATAMEKVMQFFPNDTDAAALWVAAIFDVNDWDFWEYDGKPLPNTLKVKQVLEHQLHSNPSHIGIHHYWIHLMESSSSPEVALSSAKRLASLAPHAEHMVHMPSHIYLRLGDYHQASLQNLKAIETYQNYIHDCQKQKCNPEINYLRNHNYHFLWASAMMEGRKSLAINAAQQLYKATPFSWEKREPHLQSFLSVYALALVRFGEWQLILSLPKLPKDADYAQALWHYARGMAYIHLGKTDEAYVELSELTLLERNGITQNNLGKFGHDQLNIAKEVLTAAIATHEHKTQVAIQHLRIAVDLQDHIRYKEPPAWYFPVRQALGALLYMQKDYQAAKLIYVEDLQRFPNNGWSLYGIAQCLTQLNQTAQSQIFMQRFSKAWQYAEVKPLVKEVTF